MACYSFFKAKVTTDLESKVPALITIPIPDLPPNTQFVEFEYGGKTFRYPSRQVVSDNSAQPVTNDSFSDPCSAPPATQAHTDLVACLAPAFLDTPTTPSDGTNDAQAPSSLPTVFEDDEDEDPVDITDRIQEYFSDSSASIYSELSMETGSVLDATFWDARPSLPTIRIEECEDPLPTDQDLKDTALATALSLLNITMNLLPVPPPSFNAPRTEPASPSALEDDRDPLAVLCDILELTENAFDCSFTAHTIDDADDWKRTLSTTAPLRILKAQ